MVQSAFIPGGMLTAMSILTSLLRLAVTLVTSLALATSIASASCSCVCLGGHVQAICYGALDSQPLCPANTCPVAAPVAPTIKPLQLPGVSAPRQKSCTQSMVFNGLNRQYEWRTTCR
jgi:hypothetical protein